jgi:hypothetical protein
LFRIVTVVNAGAPASLFDAYLLMKRGVMNVLSKMWLNSLLRSLPSLLLGTTMLSGVALAQVPDRVGRVAYLAGDVQFYSESAQAWLPAQLNAPVTSRNSLFTGPDGRAEIRFGSTALALDAQTQLDIHLLDDANFKAAVTRGSVSLRVRQMESDESCEVMAPGASYAMLQAGRFRIDAVDSGSSVTVLAGLVNASVLGGSSVMVESGQAVFAENGGFGRSSAHSSALDHWAAQRDNVNRTSQSARYVSPNMTGYEELDANGRWASDPDYGNVWYPTTHVTPGWAPYRDGRWAYVAPWGWTWIDAAPWGFAPFHYGRWVMIGPRWAWMPGAYVRRPSYAPALVGFIGGSAGGGGAISISIGTRPAVAWYPLPPWEHYRPAYGHHDRHLQNTNNFKIAKPPASAWKTVEHHRVSVNQVHGATVVSREAFVDSRPLRGAALSVAAPVLAAPSVAATPVAAPARSGVSPPPAHARHEVAAGAMHSSRTVEVAPQVAAKGMDPRPAFSRSESRGAERQTQVPAVAVPPASPPVSSQRQPAQAVEQAATLPVRRENLPVASPPASVPEPVVAARSAPTPAVALPVQRQPQVQLHERVAEGHSRRDGGSRESAPANVAQPVSQARLPVPQPEAAAPRVRVEAQVARPEPRMEQRVESHAVQRVEPRVEQRVEPRREVRPESHQTQRSEPAVQARVTAAQPAPQPEQKRTPERERRPHGDKDKEK